MHAVVTACTQEKLDQQKRSRNVIVYGVAESKKSEAVDRKQDDKQRIFTVYEATTQINQDQ